MADQSKVSWAQLKVGLMALAALIIVGFLIFLMAGTQSIFQSKATLYTFLPDANGLAVGSQVTLNGVNIGGKITSVDLNPGAQDPARSVRVSMQIAAKYLSEIPVDSLTELASANLLGTYYVNIKRGMKAQTVQPNAELPSLHTAEMADLFRQSSQALGTLQSVVDKLNVIANDIQSGKGSIGELLEDKKAYTDFVEIEEDFKQLASDLHNTINSSDNSVGRLLHDNGALFDDVHGAVTDVGKTVDGIQKLVDGINNGQGTLGQLVQNPAMYDDVRQILNDVHTLLAGIQAGQGTAGKLLKTDEFGDEIKNTMGKVDALLEKMNNGTGTVARLLNDPSLFEDLDSTTREVQGLLKDFRADPKKFLRIRMTIF